jgi:hypothetical protein
MRTYRFHPEDVADDRDLDRLVGAVADDGELDFGVHRAAHLIDGLVYGETLHGVVIEMRDDVVCHHAGLGRRSIVDRRDDLDQAVLHRDLDAETAELAAGLHLHVAEAVRIHITRMRIEARQHAVDRRFDELAVIRLFDVVGADALEHIAESLVRGNIRNLQPCSTLAATFLLTANYGRQRSHAAVRSPAA